MITCNKISKCSSSDSCSITNEYKCEKCNKVQSTAFITHIPGNDFCLCMSCLTELLISRYELSKRDESYNQYILIKPA